MTENPPRVVLHKKLSPPGARAICHCLIVCLLASAPWFAPELKADETGRATTKAAEQLVARVLPAQQAVQIKIEQVPAENGQDVFEFESVGDKIVLRGNNGVSIASALNRYLKDYCHCDISWNCGNQLNLPDRLPLVPNKIHVVVPYKYRYAYNYCTHGYTMAWWDWPQWEQELDFLALSGVNLALIIEGQETVWVNTLKTLGYTEAESRQWLVMPSHQPWMYMSNLEGYGGPVPEELINRRLELGQRIVARMRELGMEPVLQGYYGMVPADFGRRFSNIKIHAQGTWGDLKRPDMLDPTDPMFEKVASAFYREQTRVLGPAHFYAADPFHEGGSTNEIDVAAAGLAIQKAMRGATWVLQSWQDNPRQPMLDALDKDKVLVLDLWCEAQENWRKRNNFNGTPWLWCAINDFGGNVGMGGALEWISQGPAKAFADPARGRMSGIGALMEGTGGNPVLWELFFENASHGGMTNLDSWLKDYCLRRYGAAIPSAEKAWKILAASVYGPSSSKIEYPINSSVCARPTLKPEARARAFVTTQPNYDPARLAEAWGLLLKAAPQAARSEGYRHDLADTGREVLAGLGTRYHQQMVAAYQAKDAATLRTLSDRMLGLIRDMDELVGTRREFLLGVWLEDARRWGVTSDEKDLCERNARELLTLWTSTYNITDYANRQWNGLLGDFYYHRWELWLKALNDSVATGVPIDEGAVRQRIAEWELGWTRQHNRFPSEPRGDVVAISQRSFDKYSAEVMRSSLSESNRAQLDAAK